MRQTTLTGLIYLSGVIYFIPFVRRGEGEEKKMGARGSNTYHVGQAASR